MGTNEAKLIFAIAAEQVTRDITGRKQAATALLVETQQVSIAAGWEAISIGTPPHQVEFSLIDKHTLQVWVDKDGELWWDVSPSAPNQSPIDCLTYDPIEKAFKGPMGDGRQISAVEALATFVTDKLK